MSSARRFAWDRAGSNSAAKMPMMAMTTSNSMRVKAWRLLGGIGSQTQRTPAGLARNAATGASSGDVPTADIDFIYSRVVIFNFGVGLHRRMVGVQTVRPFEGFCVMKNGFFILLAGCLFVGVGCASVKPAPEPPAAVMSAPATNSGIAHIVKDWWATPPPDVEPGKQDDGWGWLAVGQVLQALGTLLVK